MSEIFARIATAEGWSERMQIVVLLRYVEHQASPKAFADFLADMRRQSATALPDQPADRFMWDVITLLGNPGHALNATFQTYCLNSWDLLTPAQAAERWCCWTAG